MTALTRFVALVVTVALLAAGLSLAVPDAPAAAATTGAGYPGITPYGGYLGNYIAPDGACVSKCTLQGRAAKSASREPSLEWLVWCREAR